MLPSQVLIPADRVGSARKGIMNSFGTTDTTKIKSLPNLLRKEALAALLVLVFFAIVSAIADAPLSGPADPAGTPAGDVKAPWIFVGIQQTLRYFSPLFAGVLLPMAAFVIVALIPYISDKTPKFTSVIFFTVVVASVALAIWGYYW